jgi:hypothetical protein
MKVLKGVARALKADGRFLIDYINGARVLKEFKGKIQQQEEDRLITHENTYDEAARKIRSTWTFLYSNTGESSQHLITQRLYSLDELIEMFASVGLKTINTYGDIEKSNYNEDSNRIIVVAQKA